MTPSSHSTTMLSSSNKISIGPGNSDAWLLLVPGAPVILNAPSTQYVEYGDIFWYELEISSSTDIDHYWLTVDGIFYVGSLGIIYTPSVPEIGVYEVKVHVNNTAGHNTTHAFYVIVEDTIQLSWVEVPENQSLEHGDEFLYDLDVNSGFTIDSWWVDDTARFTVDWDGRIRSLVTLTPGDHGLQVFVSDIHGSILEGRFTITVEDTLAPVLTEFSEDQVFCPDMPVSIQLLGYDPSGITWSVNDTSLFSVNSDGLLQNTSKLAHGMYSLEITALDAFDHSSSMALTIEILEIETVAIEITPTETTTTDIPTTDTTTNETLEPTSLLSVALPFIAGVGASDSAVIIILVIQYRRKSN